MTNRALCDLTLSDLGDRIRRRDVSCVDVAEAYLQQIEENGKKLNAYITLLPETAKEQARALDREIQSGRYRSVMHGIPVGLKDCLATRGVRTTAGSKIFADWVPDYDSTVASRLRESGAVLLGKHNMHELALGGTNINPFYGTARNPWDSERIPGGSSGGSASAVASGLCAAALGTDGAGSVRMPAALCGVVGLKPTYGRVSRFGVIGGSWSSDHVGTITRSVEDAAILLQVIAGVDPRDPTSARTPVPNYRDAIRADVKGLKFGVPKAYFFDLLAREVGDGVRQAVSVLEGLGMIGVEISVPHINYVTAAEWAVVRPERSAWSDEYVRTRPQDHGRDVLARLLMGKLIPAVDYLNGQRVRCLITREFEDALKQVDVIVSPTSPVAAPRIDDCVSGSLDVDGQRMDLVDVSVSLLTRCTIPFNVTGHPAVSVPCGFTDSGLPIGLQLTGRAFGEGDLLRVAFAYEHETGWFSKKRARHR